MKHIFLYSSLFRSYSFLPVSFLSSTFPHLSFSPVFLSMSSTFSFSFILFLCLSSSFSFAVFYLSPLAFFVYTLLSLSTSVSFFVSFLLSFLALFFFLSLPVVHYIPLTIPFIFSCVCALSL